MSLAMLMGRNYFSSSNANPPTGASAVLAATFSVLDAREVDANVNESVTTVAPTIRSTIFDFINIVR
jgi:hypothetical protein